jgi:hypothetical protein
MENKKVTQFEVFWRLAIILGPIILPQFIDFGRKMDFMIPLLWLLFTGPLFFLPSLNIDDWEEDAKPYHWIFNSTWKLFIGLLLLSGLLNILFGRPGIMG